MNALEADLLDRSVNRLGDTFLQNRLLKQRQEEQALQDAMRREQLGLQRDEMTARNEDRADAKSNRRLAIEAQGAHQQRLEAIHREGNETKRNQMYLEFLGELNKSGQLTDEGLGAMEQKFNEQFGAAGLGVKLFRRAEPAKPTSQDMGGGVRGIYMPGGKEVHVIDDRDTVREEIDPLTGEPKRTVTRRGSAADIGKLAPAPPPLSPEEQLNAAMRTGKTAPLQKEMAEHLKAIEGGDMDFGILNRSRPERIRELQRKMAEIDDSGLNPRLPAQRTNIVPDRVAGAAGGDRVAVISPAGKRGSVPKAQLEQALKQGFKVVQ